MNATDVITDLLARGHAVRFRAGGDSMHPFIRGDEYLLVEPVARIRVGDVVLTLADRGLTAHRVVRIDGTTVITRGDNAPGCDAPIDTARVLGRVTYVERAGKMRPIRGARLGEWFARVVRFLRAPRQRSAT